MSDLPGTGVISYQGVVFPVETFSRVNARPQRDSANRTTVDVLFTLTITSVVTVAGQPTLDGVSPTLNSIYKRLCTDGGPLHFEDKGHPNLTVNVNVAGARESRWGPKVVSIDWEPAGDNQAANVTLVLQVCVPICPDDPVYTVSVAEWCWSCTDSITDGYTTRTITGHVRIPQTRRVVTDRTVHDFADRLRELYVELAPTGFRPSFRWDNSEDKCTLRYTQTFEEMPVPLPLGILNGRASHTFECANLAMVEWVGTIDAEYEVPRGGSLTLAFETFEAVVKDRIERTREGANGKNVVPQRLSIREPDLHGRPTAGFTLVYRAILPGASKNVNQAQQTALAASGLYRPFPGADFGKWAASMETLRVHGPRGYAGLRVDGDLIVDLCMRQPAPHISQGGQTIIEQGTPLLASGGLRATILPAVAPGPGPLPNIEGRGGGFGRDRFGGMMGGAGGKGFEGRRARQPFFGVFPTELPAESSWLDYSMSIRLEVTDETVECKPLPLGPVAFADPDQSAGWSSDYSPGPLAAYQTRARPTVWVVIEGRCARAGHDIPRPVLTVAGGANPVPSNRRDWGDHWKTAVVGNVTIPIIAAVFQQRWRLADLPASGTVAPFNPIY